MKSRTSPVGVFVIVLVSLFAVGCTAQTGAVFEALLDPARAPASPSEADAAVDPVQESAPGGWWPHPDGYAMALPAGWSGISPSAADTDQLLDAVGGTHPRLALRLRALLGETSSRVSMVAVDRSIDVQMPAMILVLSQSTDGRKARYIKTRTQEQISGLPGLRGAIIRDDERLANADGVRFDYYVDDEDLGALRVRSYLFRFAGRAYIVSFIAAEGAFDDAEAAFDSIANSLRMGY